MYSPISKNSMFLSRPVRPPIRRAHSDSQASTESVHDALRTERDENVVPSTSHVARGRKRQSTLEQLESEGLSRPVETSFVPPQRPPRNPARSSTQSQEAPSSSQSPVRIVPNAKIKVARPSTATGTREEVTPWELFPAPDPNSAPGEARNSNRSPKPNHSRIPSRPSSNHGAGMSFASAFVRRRKSTDNRTLKPKSRSSSSAAAVSPHDTLPSKSQSVILGTGSHHVLTRASKPMHSASKTAPNSPPQQHSQPPSTKTSPRVPAAAAQPIRRATSKGASQTSDRHKEDQLDHLKFSTADRTILEELKRNISVRAAQFVIKGPNGIEKEGIQWGSPGLGRGKKHHPFGKTEVPYPKNYERSVLDLDVWENIFCQQLVNTLTWHPFETPPTKVLDLGCGTGCWLLDCARKWRECNFVGLDVVPIQPDLQQVGSVDLASRITWVQANFLEGLPFPNEEFDFVHIKRISLGVPEDKWDPLFEEISRVLKPGGAIEVIEEDLFFPGKPPDDDVDDDLTDLTSESALTAVSAPRRNSDLGQDRADLESVATSSADSHSRMDEAGVWSPIASVTSNSSIGPTSPTAVSLGTAVPEVVAIKEENEGEGGEPKPPVEELRLTKEPGSDDSNTEATVRPVRTPQAATPLANVSKALEEASRRKSVVGSPLVSLPHAGGIVLPQLPHRHSRGETTGKRTSVAESTSGQSASTAESIAPGLRPPVISTAAISTTSLNKTLLPPGASKLSVVTSNTPSNPPASSPIEPLSHTSPKVIYPPLAPPPNPRDHSLLEFIYSEMLASRFINMTPLSLLANTLSIYFQDLRTHPPLQFSFPPPSAKKAMSSLPTEKEQTSDSDPDEDAKDAIIPRPSKRASVVSESGRRARSLSVGSESPIASHSGGDGQWLSIHSILQSSSPFVKLDGRRMSALPPSSTKASGLASSPTRSKSGGEEAQTKRAKVIMSIESLVNLMPVNKNLKMDLRTLNLHLSLRASEILACSESMWEWILDCQQSAEKVKKGANHGRPRTADGVPSRSPGSVALPSSDLHKAAVLALTREDFERLLSNFDIDMKEYVDSASALEERFGWSTIEIPPTEERKSFEAELKKWEEWQQEHRDPTPSHRSPAAASATIPNTIQNRFRSSSAPMQTSMASEAPRASASNDSHALQAARSNSQPRRNDAGLSSPRSHRSSGLRASLSTSVSSQSTLAPPSHRVSRSMRVFVAWKAE